MYLLLYQKSTKCSKYIIHGMLWVIVISGVNEKTPISRVKFHPIETHLCASPAPAPFFRLAALMHQLWFLYANPCWHTCGMSCHAPTLVEAIAITGMPSTYFKHRTLYFPGPPFSVIPSEGYHHRHASNAEPRYWTTFPSSLQLQSLLSTGKAPWLLQSSGCAT